VFASADMLDLFTSKLASLRRRRFTFNRILPRAA
jgi:hypothetical protein